jgi:two-component system, chemotaxis family, response regulator Rcp1
LFTKAATFKAERTAQEVAFHEQDFSMISPGPPKYIVLAEDNSADVTLVRMALKSAGLNCEICVLDDGEKAIAFIEESDGNPKAVPIDLLLLDMHLPKRDGEEILKRLRSSKHYAQTPVVVMTASDAPRDYAQAAKHAAMHYFRKPTNLADYMKLGVIVRDLLSGDSVRAGLVAARGVEE